MSSSSAFDHELNTKIIPLNTLLGQYSVREGYNSPHFRGHSGAEFAIYTKSGVYLTTDLWFKSESYDSRIPLDALKVEGTFNPRTCPFTQMNYKEDEKLYLVPKFMFDSYLSSLNVCKRESNIEFLEQLINSIDIDTNNKLEYDLLKSIYEDQKASSKTLRFDHHSMYDTDVEILKLLSKGYVIGDQLLLKCKWTSSLDVMGETLSTLKLEFINKLRKGLVKDVVFNTIA